MFLDEIQRLPSILNTIQALLDESRRPIKFYLTGSSARKLKRGMPTSSQADCTRITSARWSPRSSRIR